MISNRSPYWLVAMADLETEDPLFVRNHISAEFLEATCVNSSDYCGVCNRVDPFCPHLIARSSPTANSISRTGLQPWGTPIASPDACPTCGHRPWWVEQDQDYDDDEFDECIDPQTGFVSGVKRHG